MKLVINKDRSVIPVGTWGTKNENDFEIVDFEFPEELEGYNKRIVYLLGGGDNPWGIIRDNKAYITSEITSKENVKGYVWCTKGNPDRPADTDFRSQEFDIPFYENEPATGVVPTPQQIDGFNTMLTEMNAKIDEVDALEQTIETAEAERQENENTRISNESTRESNESTRQTNEETRQTQEADRERRTDEAISNIQDKTAEYNANAEAKTNAFNQNATQKTNDFNSNYTQKVNDFNTNATTQKTDFNSNASSKTSAFNSNAETKTNAFNTNATNKTNDFNSNATEKTTTFDNNASTKTSEFNTNAESKITEFNTNAESKTTAFNENATSKTNDFNDNATEKTTAYNTNAQNKIDEYDEHIVEYQAQIDELQEEVDELSENMPWSTTEQSTEISVDDAAKYSRNKLALFGNTEQASYEGYNLIDALNMKTQDGTSAQTILKVPVNPNTDYYYYDVRNYTNTFNWGYIEEYDAEDNLTQTVRGNRNVRMDFAFSTTQNASYLVIASPVRFNSIVENPLENNIMLTEGTVKKNLEPYVGGQPSPSPDYPQPIHVVTGNNTIHVNNTDYPLSLGDMEFGKIGEYQDEFFKNEPNNPRYDSSLTENGWYKNEIIHKYIADGNETITTYISYGLPIFGILSDFDYIKALCNKYVFRSRATDGNNSIMASWNKRIQIRDDRFVHDGVADVASFKNDLSNNKLILYYLKRDFSSEYKQITDETLISQLEAIYNYLALVKGTNHITITPSDLEPYVTLTYMQDLKSKLDNLDSRLSLLE